MKIFLKSPPKGTDYELIYGAIGLLVLFAARFFPFHLFSYSCPFHSLTNYPCLSCGMTRVFVLMARQNWLGALKLNPLGFFLFVATFLFALYCLSFSLLGLKRIRVKLSKKEGVALKILIFLGLVLDWGYLICILN